MRGFEHSSVDIYCSDEDDTLVVDDPLSPEEEAGLPQKEHTLKCFPVAAPAGGEGESMSLECKESEAEPEPLIVVISTAGLDLRDILRKNVKLVLIVLKIYK